MTLVVIASEAKQSPAGRNPQEPDGDCFVTGIPCRLLAM